MWKISSGLIEDLKSKRNTRPCVSNDLHERQFSTFMLRDGVAIRWRCFVTFRLDNACISGAFHPLYRYSDTCTQCQRQYGWIKERPVEYKFPFTKHFSCPWFSFFFSSKFFGDRRDMPSLYDRDMCVKEILTIPPDFLYMLTSYQTRWLCELISIQFCFAWQVFACKW